MITATLSVKAADVPQKAAELYNQGIDYYQSGQAGKSISAFNDAIRLAPNFYEAYYNLGQIQVSENKIDDAIRTYTSIYNMRPGDDENTLTLAKLTFKRGYLAKSLTYYKQVKPESEFYAEAQKDIAKLVQRQKELEDQLKTKEATAKLTAAQKSIEQKFADQRQVAGLDIPYDTQVKALGYTESRGNSMQKIENSSVKDSVLAPQGGLKTNPFINPPTPEPTSITPTTKSGSTIYEGIQAPSGVAMDKSGNIYIASYSENLVYKINSQNQKSVFVNSNVLGGPIGVAVDNTGNVYVANYAKGDVLKVAPNGAPSVFLKMKNPYCLNVVGNYLFITEQATNTVVKYTL